MIGRERGKRRIEEMDIKMLQKSSTFSSLSSSAAAAAKKNKPASVVVGGNLGSWFDRRAKKLSMKCSRSITLGESKKTKAMSQLNYQSLIMFRDFFERISNTIFLKEYLMLPLNQTRPRTGVAQSNTLLRQRQQELKVGT